MEGFLLAFTSPNGALEGACERAGCLHLLDTDAAPLWEAQPMLNMIVPLYYGNRTVPVCIRQEHIHVAENHTITVTSVSDEPSTLNNTLDTLAAQPRTCHT